MCIHYVHVVLKLQYYKPTRGITYCFVSIFLQTLKTLNWSYSKMQRLKRTFFRPVPQIEDLCLPHIHDQVCAYNKGYIGRQSTCRGSILSSPYGQLALNEPLSNYVIVRVQKPPQIIYSCRFMLFFIRFHSIVSIHKHFD